MKLYYKLLLLFLLTMPANVYCQQDIDFHLNAHLLPGKKILKVKRDFYDPYLWVLAQNNEVYRVNSTTLAIDDYTSKFSGYHNLHFNDIAGRSKDTVFISANVPGFIHFKNGAINFIGTADGIKDTVNSVGIAGGETELSAKTTAIAMIASKYGFFFYDSDRNTLTTQRHIFSFEKSVSKVYQATYRTQMFKDSSADTKNIDDGHLNFYYQPVTFFPDNSEISTGYLWEGTNKYGYNINTAETIYTSIYAYNVYYTQFFWGNNRGMFRIYWQNSNAAYNQPSWHYLDGIKVNKIERIKAINIRNTVRDA